MSPGQPAALRPGVRALGWPDALRGGFPWASRRHLWTGRENLGKGRRTAGRDGGKHLAKETSSRQRSACKRTPGTGCLPLAAPGTGPPPPRTPVPPPPAASGKAAPPPPPPPGDRTAETFSALPRKHGPAPSPEAISEQRGVLRPCTTSLPCPHGGAAAARPHLQGGSESGRRPSRGDGAGGRGRRGTSRSLLPAAAGGEAGVPVSALRAGRGGTGPPGY